MGKAAAYRLKESHTLGEGLPVYEKGLTVYYCRRPDYGLASDDTRITGIEHYSMTLDPNGDYPSFTVPVNKLEPIPATPALEKSDVA